MREERGREGEREGGREGGSTCTWDINCHNCDKRCSYFEYNGIPEVEQWVVIRPARQLKLPGA